MSNEDQFLVGHFYGTYSVKKLIQVEVTFLGSACQTGVRLLGARTVTECLEMELKGIGSGNGGCLTE
jgi:hypothetical protein